MDNMSKEENSVGSGRTDQSQPEIPSVSSGSQPVDPRHLASSLTIENVKKLEGDYPEDKSSLVRQSVEAYLQWNNLLSFESEASLERRIETSLPSDTESEAMLEYPMGEDAAENDAEPMEKISHPDFQTRSLMSSALETKYGEEIPEGKHEFADLETQTEWSYSSTSLGSTEKAKRTLSRITLKEGTESTESKDGIKKSLRAEGREMIEIRSVVGSSEEAGAEVVLESLLKVEDHNITEYCALGFCEFCTTALKPLPSPEELERMPEKMEDVFCCRTYKEIFRCVMEELTNTRPLEGEIDISPHPRLSQTILHSRTKCLLMEELRERGIEVYKEAFEQYMKLSQWMKVGYKLSQHAPRRRTLVKRRLQPKDVLKIDPEFKPEHLKFCNSPNAVKKYYPDGKIFLLFLPDGTGQPSGNIAILITYLKDFQYTYLILADGPSKRLMAFFSNQGYVACYYPNGNIRVRLDLCHGSSFDETGVSDKCWSWWDTTDHIHAPPLQPISIQFNVYIHVKIKAQDQIFLTFTKLHNCLRLNVGARLRLLDPSLLPILQSKMQAPSVSEAKMLQIRKLLAELRKGLKWMSTAPPEQIVRLDLATFILSRLKHWRQKKKTRVEKTLSVSFNSGTAVAPVQCGHN